MCAALRSRSSTLLVVDAEKWKPRVQASFWCLNSGKPLVMHAAHRRAYQRATGVMFCTANAGNLNGSAGRTALEVNLSSKVVRMLFLSSRSQVWWLPQPNSRSCQPVSRYTHSVLFRAQVTTPFTIPHLAKNHNTFVHFVKDAGRRTRVGSRRCLNQAMFNAGREQACTTDSACPPCRKKRVRYLASHLLTIFARALLL